MLRQFWEKSIPFAQHFFLLKDELIVASLSDAVKTFENSKLDPLVIGHCIVRKST